MIAFFNSDRNGRTDSWGNQSSCLRIKRAVTATDSSVLAWRIPGTEEPGGLQFVGLQRFEQTEATDRIYWFGCIRSQLWCVELSCPTECGILVSWPEIEPVSLEGDCLSTALPRSPHCVFPTKTSNIYFRPK